MSQPHSTPTPPTPRGAKTSTPHHHVSFHELHTHQESQEEEAWMKVLIPAREDHEGIFAMQVRLSWRCPRCDGPRGTPDWVRSCDGSLSMRCSGWQNPCGHVDRYSACRQEARASGLNPELEEEYPCTQRM